MNRARPEEELTRREDLDPEPITAQLRADNPQMPEDSCLTPRAKQAEAGQEAAREDGLRTGVWRFPWGPAAAWCPTSAALRTIRRGRAARSRTRC